MGKKLFGTDGVRGVANVYPMTADFALKLAYAAGELICTDKRKVAIAKDTRVSGDMLEAALSAGFTAKGIDVVLLGVLPTPALTTITPDLGVDMAVMITASHNPYQDNGIKLINAAGDKFPDSVTAQLEDLIAKNEFSFEAEKIGRVFHDNSGEILYRASVKKAIPGEHPLKGLRVVLDCANGVFSKIMPEVFKELGAGVIAIGNEPNGYNINRDCGSQHIQKMQETVKASKAHLGIAADGDGDRIIICDENGDKVNAEQIIAFLAQYMYQNGSLQKRAVASTILSNTGLENFIRSMGIEYYSTQVGERYVIEQLKACNGAVGGEESGHMVVMDYSKSGDALVTALMVVQGVLKSGKKVSEVFPVFAMEPFVFVNPRFASQDIIAQVLNDENVKKAIEDGEKKINGKGRIVVRASGTEPLIRIWVCGSDEVLVKEVSARIIAEIEKFQ